MKPIMVDLSKSEVSSYLEHSILLSDVITDKGKNVSTLTTKGTCLKFATKAVDTLKVIAQNKKFFHGQDICTEKCGKIELITIRQTKDNVFLFDTFKKLGLAAGTLTIGVNKKSKTIYVSPKFLRDLNKFPLETIKMLSMYLISLHTLLYKLCKTTEVFTYEAYATAITIPDSFITNIGEYLYEFNEDNNTWSLEEIDLNETSLVINLTNQYATMPIVEETTKLLGNFTILKGTPKEKDKILKDRYFLVYTYGTLALNPTYYVITESGIFCNNGLCAFDFDNSSLLSKLYTFLPSVNLSIMADSKFFETIKTAYDFSVVDISEMDNNGLKDCFEKSHKYLTDRGASDVIGVKQLISILGIDITTNKSSLDSESIRDLYKDDEYAQKLYEQEQPYFSSFNLKDLTPCLKGFVKGDIYSMMFLGESGTGKSTAAKVIPSRCGLPFVLINFSVNIEESDLFGSMIPNVERTSELDSEFKWQDGVITRAIRNGYVCVLEEINFARPGVLGKLNSLLDEARQIDLPNGEVLKAHPNFRMIATCNIAYEGTNRFNKALINRFEIVKEFIDLNRDETITIVNERLGYTDRPKIEMVYNVYEAIKKYSKEQNADVVISIRQILNIFSKGKYFKNAYDAVINMLINSAFVEEPEYKAHFIETVLVGFDLNFKI